MKRVVVALLALGLMAGAAEAAGKAAPIGNPPTAAQHDEFHRVCMGIAQDEGLCSCKADAAMKLVDEKFMGVIIASMKGKAPPTADNLKYAEYIGRSNQVCKPNY